jgi:hypothetical protein
MQQKGTPSTPYVTIISSCLLFYILFYFLLLKRNFRIQKELADITLDPPANISAGPKGESNIMEWNATVMGPQGTLLLFYIFMSFNSVVRSVLASDYNNYIRFSLCRWCVLFRHSVLSRVPIQASKGTINDTKSMQYIFSI